MRGQVGEVVQQLDIMPTLLGLLGNTESYFAFGRDVLNEPQRQQWSVSWDGAFQAVTNDGTIRFDDAQDKPEAVGRRGLPPAGFPRPCPAILFPRRKKELHRP